MKSGASSSSSVCRSPLAKASRKRRASALFSSSDDTAAFSSLLLADIPFLYRVDTISMMPAGGIRHIGWRLIQRSAWNRNSPKLNFRFTEFSEVRAVMLTGMRRSGGITWLVAPGLATIAVTYGLARFAYGLFLPEMRESLDLSDSVLGLIGAGSYTGYCLAVLG